MAIPNVDINFWAVLVAAIAGMIIGYIWYGPLFGKLWISLSKINKQDIEKAKKKGMGKLYLIAFIRTIVMSLALALFVKYLALGMLYGLLSLPGLGL